GQGEGVGNLAAQAVQACVVLGDAVPVVIERQVYDHPQCPGFHGLDQRIGDFCGVAEVAEDYLDGAGGGPPGDGRGAGAVLLWVGLVDAELGLQDRAESFAPPGDGVLAAGALEDLVKGQLFQGDGDQGVARVAAHGDLGDRGVPFPDGGECLRGGVAGDNDGEFVVVELGGPAGGECFESRYLGCERGEEQGLGEPQSGAQSLGLVAVGQCGVLAGELGEHGGAQLLVPQGAGGAEPGGH